MMIFPTTSGIHNANGECNGRKRSSQSHSVIGSDSIKNHRQQKFLKKERMPKKNEKLLSLKQKSTEGPEGIIKYLDLDY